MFNHCRACLFFTVFIFFNFIYSCKSQHAATEKQVVEKPVEMDAKVDENIKDVLQYALDNSGHITDSIKLHNAYIVNSFYQTNDYKNIWSSTEHWLPLADSMYNFISGCEYYGLFPADYHFADLKKIKDHLATDTTAKKDANLWTKADLLLTDAFMLISKHLKQGRLLPDSLSLSADTSLTRKFFINNLNTVLQNRSLTLFLQTLEPKHAAYIKLKSGLKKFVDSMDKKRYTYILYPYKDSLAFIKNVKVRLQEGGFLTSVNTTDSTEMANAIKKAQKAKGIKADGKISAPLIKNLNNTDIEKFKRIAINLDRYKLLPPLPQKYIWVNLPQYYLQVWNNDTMAFDSKVIVGKPATRTPVLSSEITDMVTYPQWTIPGGIIKKEVLPALKRDPGYISRKGFSLVDAKGEAVDPYSINWAKYTKAIPYKVVQGSGDDNALGILKFNFNNPYSVYLHDTNQRYLFKNTARALSHGCVRVQEWQKLAFYLAENDSIHQTPENPPNYNADSIMNWLNNKVRKRIVVKNRLPLFIRYFTCDTKNGKIIFYDDIYGEDKMLREKYFANK